MWLILSLSLSVSGSTCKVDEAALSEAEAALSRNSRSAPHHSALARLYARAGRVEEAERLFAAAAAIAPPSLIRIAAARPYALAVYSASAPPTTHEQLPVGDSGGWPSEEARLTEAMTESEACPDVDVRANLSPEQFWEDYVLPGKPVLLPMGLLRPWGAPPFTKWSRTELLERAGHRPTSVIETSHGVTDAEYRNGVAARRPEVAVGSGSSVGTTSTTLSQFVLDADAWQARGSPRGTAGLAANPTRLSATKLRVPRASGEKRDVVEELILNAPNADPSYLFSAEGALAAELAADFELAGLAISPHFLPLNKAKRIFFLGPSRSGTFFHAHSHTFNVLAHGAKHWLLLPPGAPYGAQGRTAAAWLERLKRGGDTADEVSPADSPPALRCTQRAGQVLFVPSGWNHATTNLGWAVGVAAEVGDVAMMEAASRM